MDKGYIALGTLIIVWAIVSFVRDCMTNRRMTDLEMDSLAHYKNAEIIEEAVNSLIEDMDIQTGATQSMMDEVNRLNSRVDDMIRIGID